MDVLYIYTVCMDMMYIYMVYMDIVYIYIVYAYMVYMHMMYIDFVYMYFEYRCSVSQCEIYLMKRVSQCGTKECQPFCREWLTFAAGKR